MLPSNKPIAAFLSKAESGDHSGQITFRNTVLTHDIHLNHIDKETNTHNTFTSYREDQVSDTEYDGCMVIVHVFTYRLGGCYAYCTCNA